MEKIGRHNYEAYFLDYMEGVLSDEEKKEVELFVEANSDLKEELKGFEIFELDIDIENPSFNSKENLKREVSTSLLVADYLMIAEVEGVNSKEEKAKLSQLVEKDPSRLEDLSIYHKTKLKKTGQFVFKNKEGLKRKSGLLISFKRAVYYSGAAAAILLAFLYFNQLDTKYSPIAFEPTALIIEDSFEQDETDAFIASLVKEEYKTTKEIVIMEKEKTPFERSERIQVEEIEPIESADYIAFETSNKETKPKSADTFINESSVITEEPKTVSPKKEEEYVPMEQYAKNQIQDKVLRGKTISENIQEGLATLSDDKITFDIEKTKENKIQKFALNIGKFSISRTN